MIECGILIMKMINEYMFLCISCLSCQFNLNQNFSDILFYTVYISGVSFDFSCPDFSSQATPKTLYVFTKK